MKYIFKTHHPSKKKIAFPENFNHGFSFLEVIAGILLTLIFTGIAMQSLVASTFLKVRAEEENDSANWIQENIEFIRHRADKLDYNNATANYDLNPSACQATSEAQGYGSLLRNDLNQVEFGGGTIANNAAPDNDKEFNMVSSKGNRPYIVHRRTQVKTDNNYGGDPYFNILEVAYSVLDSQRKEISRAYVEIIPEVSLRCPQ